MPSPASATPPLCRRLGPQCLGLEVILRVSSLDDGIRSGDHEATWLLGHSEHIDFGELWLDEGELYVEAVLHVPCRHLEKGATGGATCRAHGFQGHAPRAPRPIKPPVPRRLGEDRFVVVERAHEIERTLPPPALPPRSLPIASGVNPCATAPCRTADNRRGAACCRDLQIEIMCTTRQRNLEALVRSRRSPYLCKVVREGKFSLGAEMISACGYLKDDGIECALHGRTRADGRPAKPDLCSKWPDDAETTHFGCVFAK
jgi:hypothetical protein